MPSLLSKMFSVIGLCVASSAFAASYEGRLELTWGDPAPDSSGKAQFRAGLRTDDGRLLTMDPAQAVAATDHLHEFFGKRIAAEFSSSASQPAAAVLSRIRPAETGINAMPMPQVSGNTVWVTLLCKFSDITEEQKPLEFFSGQYGENPGQLGHYWREVSYDRINLLGSSAHGWFTLPHPRSYYVRDMDGVEEADLDQVWEDCTAAADAEVDFAANGGVQGINMMFNGELDGYAWGGGRCGLLDGINRCWSSTWNPPWSFSNLAPLGHEMGHGYGLPHANNSDLDDDPYDNPWDVMSSAWYNGTTDVTYGILAKHLSTYSRDALGFIDAARKREITTKGVYADLRIDRASLLASDQLQMITVGDPGAGDGRYYTIEARKRGGYYEGNLAGDAVIIHEVVPYRNEPAWSLDARVPPADMANNEGSMFKVGESWSSPNGDVRVDVLSATAEGFVVRVVHGIDRLFSSGFE